MPDNILYHPSSYRDPSGFIFEKDGVLYRQVNLSFREHFDHFRESGCYEHLVKKNLLVAHEITPGNLTGSPDYYLTLRPERIPYISYPYEWSFGMLREAALLTLQLVKECLPFGIILKDATPFNIQWRQGKPVFIDSLSFEKYKETPWIAYRQFCETFLGPLLIMHYSKQQLPGLSLAWLDGIPVTITKSLLPRRSRFSLFTYLHIHLHARISAKPPGKKKEPEKLPRQKFLNLITSLETLVKKSNVPGKVSTWSGYYEEVARRKDYLAHKKKIVEQWIDPMPGIRSAIDLGANEGEFCKLLSSKGIRCIAADFDPYCIETLYRSLKETGEKNIHPIILDLANPSPSIGVNNSERLSFSERTYTDIAIALAVVHHLRIGRNIPFPHIARFLAPLSEKLIIEFVPAEDDKAAGLLAQKPGILADYNKESFVAGFSSCFSIEKEEEIKGSGRILFLMRKLKDPSP